MTRLLRQLRAAGFAIDTGRELELRRVLHERGRDYVGRFAELKYLLAPYVVTNAREQERFYQFWDDYTKVLEERAGPRVGAEPADSWWEKVGRRLLGGLLSLLVLSGIIYLLWPLVYLSFNNPDEEARLIIAPLLETPREGDTLKLKNATTPITTPGQRQGFAWRVVDQATGAELHSADTFETSLLLPPGSGRQLRAELRNESLGLVAGSEVATLDFAVACASPPTLDSLQLPTRELRRFQTRTFSVQKEPATDYRWVIGQDTFLGERVLYRFSQDGPLSVELRASRSDDPEHCFALHLQNLVVGTDQPILATLPLKRDVPSQILGVQPWLYFLGGGLTLLALFWRDRWWRAKERREKAAARRQKEALTEIYDAGPYTIPYRSQVSQIRVPADFFRIADGLRVREAGLLKVFDGPATVEATVAGGGFPAWRERPLRRPARYLFLVRHTDEFNHQDLLLRRLTDFLVEREASITVYYHGGAFDHFWNEAHPEGYTPVQLQTRYGQYRLVILGNGHGLVDAYESRQPQLYPDKLKWLLGWPRRLVLTTEAVADWSFPEMLLHRYFLLFPASSQGLRAGVPALNRTEEYTPPSYRRWYHERLRLNSAPGIRDRRWTTVGDHRDYLRDDPELFRWLAACSVASQTDWNLTIAIGRALSIEVTHDRLLRLSRIPWLAENTPDPELRLEFLSVVSSRDQRLSREAVLRELEAVRPEIEKSFAQSEWQTSEAVQLFGLDSEDRANRARVRALHAEGLFTDDQLQEMEQSLIAREKPREKGAIDSATGTQRLEEILAPSAPQEKLFSRRILELLLIGLVGLLLMLPLYLFQRAERPLQSGDTTAWWQQVSPLNDRALEAHNRAVLQSEYLTGTDSFSIFQYRQEQVGRRVEVAFDSALLLRNGNYPLVDTNEWKHRYNLLARELNGLGLDSFEIGQGEYVQREFFADQLVADGGNRFGFSPRLYLLGVHARGILHYYGIGRTNEDSFHVAAMLRRYREITELDPTFFDSLAVTAPVNLRTLVEPYLIETSFNGTAPPPDTQQPSAQVEPPSTVEPSQDQINAFTLSAQLVDEDKRPLIVDSVVIVDKEGIRWQTSDIRGRVRVRLIQAIAGRIGSRSLRYDQGDAFRVLVYTPAGDYQFTRRLTSSQGDLGTISIRDMEPLSTNESGDYEGSFSEGLYQRRDRRFHTNLADAGRALDAITQELSMVGSTQTVYNLSGVSGRVNLINSISPTPLAGDEEGIFVLYGELPHPDGILPLYSYAPNEFHAMIIALGENEAGEFILPQLEARTEALRNQLASAGFSDTRVITNANTQRLAYELDNLATDLAGTEPGQLLIYVIGVVDDNNYLVTANATLASASKDGFPLAELENRLLAIGKEHFLIVEDLVRNTERNRD